MTYISEKVRKCGAILSRNYKSFKSTVHICDSVLKKQKT